MCQRFTCPTQLRVCVAMLPRASKCKIFCTPPPQKIVCAPEAEHYNAYTSFVRRCVLHLNFSSTLNGAERYDSVFKQDWQLVLELASCLWSLPCAHAAFHLWKIDEVYSNASGTVQFIEMDASSNGGQQFTTGQSLTSGAHTFTFSGSHARPIPQIIIIYLRHLATSL